LSLLEDPVRVLEVEEVRGREDARTRPPALPRQRIHREAALVDVPNVQISEKFKVKVEPPKYQNTVFWFSKIHNF